MGLISKIYLGLPQTPVELLVNGTFEDVAGDDFADWTETIPGFVELADNIDLELVAGDNFNDWTEVRGGTGDVEDEQVEVHGDVHSVKVTCNAGGNIGEFWQQVVTEVGKRYQVTAWVKGDYWFAAGTAFPAAVIDSGTAAAWTQKTIEYTSEEIWGRVSVSCKSTGDANEVAYYDDFTFGLKTGDIERTADAHAGDDAVLITGAGGTNTQPYIKQEVVSDPFDAHRLSFWSKGDGVAGVAYQIYDVTNGAEITSGYGTINAVYTETVDTYYVPTGCVLLRITFSGNGNSVVYVDDASILEYGDIAWVNNTDVLAVPAPTWGYGLGGKDPLRGVAQTGTANFTLENAGGEDSPENAARLSGFEEGMPVKITTALPEAVEIDDNVLLNGTFEVWD